MNVASALFRLLVAGAISWLAFWGWRYAVGCIHAQQLIFFCPDAAGQSLVRTNLPRMIGYVLVPPLASLAISYWIWRSQHLSGRASKFDQH